MSADKDIPTRPVSKREKYGLITIGIAIIIFVVLLSDRFNNPQGQAIQQPLTTPQGLNEIKVEESTNGGDDSQMNEVDELVIEDIKVGSGEEVGAGQRAIVHYTGTLVNGNKFDSSRDRGAPFAFTIGAGEVIEGWDKGVAGMKVGGIRKLTIPPHMGYGSRSMGEAIPANSTLVFEVELLDIE